jgi:hypothetical protein
LPRSREGAAMTDLVRLAVEEWLRRQEKERRISGD